MSDVFSRLQERQQARLSALEERRTLQQGEKREEETPEYFTKQLETNKHAILSLLSAADGLSKAELSLHFNKISVECQNLQKFVSDSVLFITDYDKKIAQKQISDLLQQVNAKQEQLLPPKKFSFSSRQKKAAPKPACEVKVQSGGAKSSEKGLAATLAGINSKVVAGKCGAQLEMASAEINGQDLHLSSLEKCEVRLFGAPGTLHMTNVTGSTVFCGPVSGSVFVEHCKDCVFVVACQQLRVHSSSSSQFYLHITSRPIIEDCQHLSFAPFSWTYPTIRTDFENAGLDESTNSWDKVDDFNWLASHEPSPNWSILPPDKRTNFPS